MTKRSLPTWLRLAAAYYEDPDVIDAGEPAEVLFIRGLGYAKRQGTEGFIPAQALPYIVQSRAKQRVARLVQVGLWIEVEGGWRIRRWDLWQDSLEEIEASREGARERQRKSRANRKTNGGVTRDSHVGHAADTDTDTDTEDAAAAASRADAAAAAAALADDLPTTVAILRSRLQSYAALSALRFDQLRPAQVDQLIDLIALHGDQRLVDVALRTVRTPPPVSVAAFLGTWAALPAPGQTLAVVRDQRCTLPGHQGTTRHCVECSAEAHAGGLK